MSRRRPTARAARLSRRAFVAAAGASLLLAGGAGYGLHRLNRVSTFRPERLLKLRDGQSNPLFVRYPALAESVPWIPLAELPSPVDELVPPDGMRRGRLFVKRDDVISPLYGGNKLRKLELTLAEACLAGADTLVTLGGIGSNQAVATSLHGSRLGFDVELSLFDHPVGRQTLPNLRGCLAAGARVHYADRLAGCLWNARSAVRRLRNEGATPYFLPPGASNRLGNTGFVIAGLELAEQVAAGLLPEPDTIFVGAGTCGTAGGLLAGLRLGGLRSQVVAVRTAEPAVANRFTVRAFASDCLRWLSRLDPAVAAEGAGIDGLVIDGDHLGEAYAVPTPEAEAAVAWAAPQLQLETTYTGKALAAALRYCRGPGRDRNVLFWNTFNSQDFPKADALEPLPPALQQRLDGVA